MFTLNTLLALTLASSCCLAASPEILEQKSTKVEVANMASGCNIKIKVPNDAKVSSSQQNRGSGAVIVDNPRHLSTKHYIEPLTLGFICYDSNGQNLFTGQPVRYDEQEKKWVRDITKRFSPIDDDDLKHALDKAIRFHELKAVNAQGYAYTEDDVIGDEDSRVRMLHFCLIHPPKALCGKGEMGSLKAGKKADLTSYSLQILRSVEFLDDPPPGDAAAP